MSSMDGFLSARPKLGFCIPFTSLVKGARREASRKALIRPANLTVSYYINTEIEVNEGRIR